MCPQLQDGRSIQNERGGRPPAMRNSAEQAVKPSLTASHPLVFADLSARLVAVLVESRMHEPAHPGQEGARVGLRARLRALELFREERLYNVLDYTLPGQI